MLFIFCAGELKKEGFFIENTIRFLVISDSNGYNRAMTDALFFLVKYIPFWAIPIGVLCVPFGYVYWIKDVRKISFLFVALGSLCGIFTLYWILTGGPNRSVKFIIENKIENLQ